MNKLFIILPCYNEEIHIKKLIKAWLTESKKLECYNIDKVEIVVVDDGSSDKTVDIVESLNKQEVTVIRHKTNKGLGETLNTGINYCLNKGSSSDYVCIMDGDYTHLPIYIHRMLKKMIWNQHDCVIASRYQEDSVINGVSKFRRKLSDFASMYYRITLQIPNVYDYTCGFRLYKMTILKRVSKKYGKKIIDETGFSCMVELLYKLAKIGASFGESSFNLRYDLKGGISKMKITKTIITSLTMPFKL